MISSVGHAGIVVSNLEQAIDFYCGVLGLELQAQLEREGPYIDQLVGLGDVRMRVAVVGTPNQRYAIELLEYVRPPGPPPAARPANTPGCNHVQFFVVDIESSYRRLQEQGVEFHSPPLQVPGLPKKAVYFRDPDGTILELNEVTPDQDPY